MSSDNGRPDSRRGSAQENTMNRQWLLENRPVGMPSPDTFELVETQAPEPDDGQVLLRLQETDLVW